MLSFMSRHWKTIKQHVSNDVEWMLSEKRIPHPSEEVAHVSVEASIAKDTPASTGTAKRKGDCGGPSSDAQGKRAKSTEAAPAANVQTGVPASAGKRAEQAVGHDDIVRVVNILINDSELSGIILGETHDVLKDGLAVGIKLKDIDFVSASHFVQRGVAALKRLVHLRNALDEEDAHYVQSEVLKVQFACCCLNCWLFSLDPVLCPADC